MSLCLRPERLGSRRVDASAAVWPPDSKRPALRCSRGVRRSGSRYAPGVQPCLEESILNRVRRPFVIAQDQPSRREETRSAPCRQRRERLDIPSLRSDHEVLVHRTAWILTAIRHAHPVGTSDEKCSSSIARADLSGLDVAREKGTKMPLVSPSPVRGIARSSLAATLNALAGRLAIPGGWSRDRRSPNGGCLMLRPLARIFVAVIVGACAASPGASGGSTAPSASPAASVAPAASASADVASSAISAEAVVLRVSTVEPAESPEGQAVTLFADQIARLSKGSMSVLSLIPNGESDQENIKQVMSGEIDLAIVQARNWDEFGVTSMQALQTPFLITSDAAAAAATSTGALADRMMSGLAAKGVQGLALWPIDLRHPCPSGRSRCCRLTTSQARRSGSSAQRSPGTSSKRSVYAHRGGTTTPSGVGNLLTTVRTACPHPGPSPATSRSTARRCVSL